MVSSNHRVLFSISKPHLVSQDPTSLMCLVACNTQCGLLVIVRRGMLLKHPMTLLPNVAMTPMRSTFRNVGNGGVFAHVYSPGCACWTFRHTTTLPSFQLSSIADGFLSHDDFARKYSSLPVKGIFPNICFNIETFKGVNLFCKRLFSNHQHLRGYLWWNV